MLGEPCPAAQALLAAQSDVALWVASESASAALARKGIASLRIPRFRAGLRRAHSDRNGGSAEFFNSLSVEIPGASTARRGHRAAPAFSGATPCIVTQKFHHVAE